jgi:hypothetical protein
MPSPLTDGTPGSDVPTHKRCVLGGILTSGVLAFWIFDSALVFRLGFDEDSARSAVLRQFVEIRLKPFDKPLSMFLLSFLKIRGVFRLSQLQDQLDVAARGGCPQERLNTGPQLSSYISLGGY